MSRFVLIALVGSLLILSNSCGLFKKAGQSDAQSDDFDFSAYTIRKDRMGNIQLGMSLKEAEKELKGLERMQVPAFYFGFGGGSDAYTYSHQGEDVLALIPHMHKDSVIAIVALHEKIKTSNGLSPGDPISKIKATYPEKEFEEDQMNGWLLMMDQPKSWQFIFVPKPEEKEQTIEWITIF
jgi:hypothetical protein